LFFNQNISYIGKFSVSICLSSILTLHVQKPNVLLSPKKFLLKRVFIKNISFLHFLPLIFTLLQQFLTALGGKKNQNHNKQTNLKSPQKTKQLIKQHFI